jgi:hypothetical protein
MTEATFPIASRKRQVGFYITVGLFSLLLIAFTGFMIPVLPSVIIGWFNPDLFGIHQLHEMNGGGAINWLLLAGMLLQLHHPERKVAALQMANLVVISTIVVSLVAGTFFFPIIIFLVFTVTAAYLVALAAVPLIIYAVNHINLQWIAVDEHAELTHYGMMANMAVTLLLIGLLASFKTVGWPIPAWGAGFVAIVFGLTSVVFPEQSSSVGLLWGILAILWGLTFIGVAEWKRLKEREA